MTHEADLRVSVVQFEAAASDTQRNLETVRRLAARAAEDGSRLVVFPEMCLLGYWHLTKTTAERLRELAEPADGPSVSALRRIAADFGVGIGAGFLEVDGDALYNSYAVCFPDGAVHIHRKLHAFEHEAISSGDRYTVFDTPWGVRMGTLICWDNNLVENVRAVALLGAKVLIAPHQTGGTRSRSPHGMKVIPSQLWHDRREDPGALRAAVDGPDGRGWLMRWLPARAHDNGLFVLFSNGIGPDDDEIRTGNAMIIDPYGRIVAETPVADEAVVTADLDLDLLPLATGRRWLLGRRPELYGVLTRRSGLERDPRAARHSDAPVADDFRIDDEPAADPTTTPVSGWLAALAQPQGDPGGGAACGVMLGISASLLRMVAEYTDDPQATDAAVRLVRLREDALAAAETDGIRSAEFGAALRLPTDDPAREGRVREASVEAARSSAVLGGVGIDLLPELRLLAEIGNRNLMADLAVAAEALAAGITGASINLRANLQLARKYDIDPSMGESLSADIRRLRDARSTVIEIAGGLSAAFDD